MRWAPRDAMLCGCTSRSSWTRHEPVCTRWTSIVASTSNGGWKKPPGNWRMDVPDNVETERKFLVTDAALVRRLMADRDTGQHFHQGYLFERGGVSARVRHAGSEAVLTFKGTRRGATRMEYEDAIPPELAT